MTSDVQSGYALVAAAFVTGIWAWVAQRARGREEREGKSRSHEISDRQKLVEEYRLANKQLSERNEYMQGQISRLWEMIPLLQNAIAECESARVDDIRKMAGLERRILELETRLGK